MEAAPVPLHMQKHRTDQHPERNDHSAHAHIGVETPLVRVILPRSSGIVRIRSIDLPRGAPQTPRAHGHPDCSLIGMRSLIRGISICCRGPDWLGRPLPAAVGAHGEVRYRIETRADRTGSLRERFAESQFALLEKLNRADLKHLEQLREVVVPESWATNCRTACCRCAIRRAIRGRRSWLSTCRVSLFGAYEFGNLVRWGPVSSGSRNNPTSAGSFALNWRSTGRASTVDPDWFMRWYFNFGNREGLAFHAYSLPGYPASHGCIRLLERDAQWLFEWGQAWLLDPTRDASADAGDSRPHRRALRFRRRATVALTHGGCRPRWNCRPHPRRTLTSQDGVHDH